MTADVDSGARQPIPLMPLALSCCDEGRVRCPKQEGEVCMTALSYLPSRYERKYLVSDAKARAIREAILHRVKPDEYLVGDAAVGGYPVYSLYLDCPRLSLYEATAQGLLNRFKLRIRFYDEDPEHPVFFEIKRRIHQVIQKQRATVRRSSVERLLAGSMPVPEDLEPGLGDKRSFVDLQEFCRLRASLSAVGTLIVGYDREAYIDPVRGSTRVTFDRRLRASRFDPTRGLTTDAPLIETEEQGVILELKYVDRLPTWMQHLIRDFGLERQSIPKYGWSVEAFGERRVADSAVHRNTGFTRHGRRRGVAVR